MKAVILAGGTGTRISEETGTRPKPMIEIGERPLLWHIMKLYSHHGISDFVICAGYKGYVIKEYFRNYWLHNCDVTFDLKSREVEVHHDSSEPWHVTVVDTGTETMTGGRLKRVREYLGESTFMLTYGDGLGDVNLSGLLAFHREHGRAATVTAVQPSGRFGALELGESGMVESFTEKPAGDGAWINGGFFVLEPAVFDYIEGDGTSWEREPLERLAGDGQLAAYRHDGFWQPMDTLRDKVSLEAQWATGRASWKVW